MSTGSSSSACFEDAMPATYIPRPAKEGIAAAGCQCTVR